MAQHKLLCLFILQTVSRWVESFCPSMCQCNDSLLESRCISSRLDTVPILLNPGLRSLHLRHNRISTVQQSLGFYSELRKLDLSYNLLHTLGGRNFETLRNLEMLNISNNIITAVESDSFSGLNALTVLDLSGNRLALLQAGVFSELNSLRTLILSENRIKSVHEHAFYGLRHTTVLYLDANNLHQVPSASLTPLSNLRQLWLGRNSIELLDDLSFERLARLEHLSLNDNAMRQIDPLAFHNLKSIQSLDLSFNRLVIPPMKALTSTWLKGLRILDVSGNMWREIPAHFLRDFPNLQVLNVSFMEDLRFVDPTAFSNDGNNSSLRELVMTNNALWNYFHPDLLNRLVNLKKLDVSGNAFETFPEPVMPSLEFLSLSYNPVQCNCSIVWLWQLVQPKSASSPGDLLVSNITCSGPNPIAGIPLSYLTVEDLQCITSAQFLTVVLPLFIGLWIAILAGLLVYCRLRRKKRKLGTSGTGISPILTKKGSVSRYDRSTHVTEDEYTYHCAGNMRRIPVTVI